MGTLASKTVDIVYNVHRCVCGAVKKNRTILVCSKCAQHDTISDEALYHVRNNPRVLIEDHPRITYIPALVFEMGQLQTLVIVNCPMLKHLDGIGQLDQLIWLWLENCSSLTELPATIGGLVRLQELEIRSCRLLAVLPDTINRLSLLEELMINDCPALTTLPTTMRNMSVGSMAIVNCPALSNVHTLPVSRSLHVEDCVLLTILPNLDPIVETLTIMDCTALKTLPLNPNNVHVCQLRDLTVIACNSICAIPTDLGRLRYMESLSIISCPSLTCLPDTICDLFTLCKLDLFDNANLRELPTDIGKLCSLTELTVSRCDSLTAIPDTICMLSKLQSLQLSKNPALTCVNLQAKSEHMHAMRQIKTLDVSNCGNMQRLVTTVNMLACLEFVYADGCNAEIILASDDSTTRSIGRFDEVYRWNTDRQFPSSRAENSLDQPAAPGLRHRTPK